jgi:hypothetical protein
VIFYEALFLSTSIYRYCCLLFKALYHNENSDVIIIFMFLAVFDTLYMLKTMLGEDFQGVTGRETGVTLYLTLQKY